MKPPKDKPVPADDKEPPDKAHKPSRVADVRKVIKEYADAQREILKALRKKFFH